MQAVLCRGGWGGGEKKKFSHAHRNHPWWRVCLVKVENCYNKETYLSLLKSSNFLQIFEDEYYINILWDMLWGNFAL